MGRHQAGPSRRSDQAPPSLDAIQRAVPRCRRCPELRAYCAEIGVVKRRAYAGWDYWAKPVPGFGDQGARIMIVGLAPAAHGANRTGRMFTGDRSGDFLYAALHRAGLANQPLADSRDDGLVLCNVYITAALRCAPPGNKPTPRQLDRCSSYLLDELAILRPAVTVCLGSLAWNAVLAALRTAGERLPRPKPKFAHGLECPLGLTVLLGCYHVSQQNTFTGRLTEPMIDTVLRRANAIAASRPMC
ncbi:MAG: uracil-DNA glycosylase [Planctomycetes bacterium]|nr:uracil-DNA glycosylase [Planctomycetota bacterium]